MMNDGYAKENMENIRHQTLQNSSKSSHDVTGKRRLPYGDGSNPIPSGYLHSGYVKIAIENGHL